MMAGRWMWFPGPFSSRSSRIFAEPPPGPHALGRSQSSHFCDLNYEDTDDESVVFIEGVDEEMAVVKPDHGVVSLDLPMPGPQEPAQASSSRRSRLGVMLLGQGLFTVYKRLFVLCVASNVLGLALAATGHFHYAGGHASVFAMGNILALTLCRSEAVLRVVFWLAVALLGRPWVPVAVKTGATSILQSLGGVHSGCGVSSLACLAYALVQAIQQQHSDANATPREVVGVASAILALLALSCLAAFPLVRHLHHNVFERTHRFAGWSALALLWVFVLLSAAGYDPATGAMKCGSPLPLPSSSSCHGSPRSPLSEWHAFGIISDNGDTHAMLAGAVGDFTQALISDPPTRLWVRGVHFAGLPYLLNMYRRATMVATGSGICVFMSFLMRPGPAELSLVWVAKGIEANYGEEMKAACCNSERLRGRVIVHDTAVMGRPNVAALAVDAARRCGSEVVVVTSNPEGSRDVVRGCNKAGIPAFGPIWDY
ncbi:hypothetical protein HU200_036532 [Digitaria exilis]|uniref:Uncharacterized protein n=1 Tax=Digitaria exilis TaxID=1010633 RepID=A0A835BGW9_9POAL|nr:hypothetical protein HU200_036532 [Digitaria exilis]